MRYHASSHTQAHAGARSNVSRGKNYEFPGRSAKLEESLHTKSDRLIEKRDELHKKWQQLQELSEEELRLVGRNELVASMRAQLLNTKPGGEGPSRKTASFVNSRERCGPGAVW